MSYRLTEKGVELYPHLILIFIFGFFCIMIFSPIASFFIFPPSTKTSLLGIYVDYLPRILSKVGIIPIIILSFGVGIAFDSLYGGVRGVIWWVLKGVVKTLFPKSKHIQTINEAEELLPKPGIAKEYAEFQYWLAENPGKRSYHNWEWFITFSSEYIIFATLLFLIVDLTMTGFSPLLSQLIIRIEDLIFIVLLSVFLIISTRGAIFHRAALENAKIVGYEEMRRQKKVKI